jgi:hypothetical protein
VTGSYFFIQLFSFTFSSSLTLANLPISDFSPDNDRDFPDDLINGWKRKDTDVSNAPFTGEAKLNVDLQNFEPLEFLKLFIDDDFILELVRQTNSYAEIKVNDDENVKENSTAFCNGLNKNQKRTIYHVPIFYSVSRYRV